MSISVIIPAYNAEATIKRAIASVRSQTDSVDEIIVVDDGSSDNTAQVVGQYGSAVRYYFQDNAGPSTARNTGIMNSRCEWIGFLDADDEWLPNWVKAHREILNRYPECKWSSCNFEYARDGIYWRGQGSHFSSFQGPIYYFEAMRHGMKIGTPGFLVHRGVFDKVGMFNPELKRGEDIDLWSRVAMRFPRIGYSPDICWHCHIDNVNSLTRMEHSRGPQVKNICENVVLARSIGKDVIEAYYPYARKRAMSYILRAAAKKVQVRREVLDEAKTMFPLTLREHVLEAALKMLPVPIADKVVGRLVD